MMGGRLARWSARWSERHRVLTIVVVSVLVSAPGYGVMLGLLDNVGEAGERAENATDLLKVQRGEARVTACLNDRRFAQAHNGLVQYLADVPRSTPRTPEQQALVEDYLKVNLVPVRECDSKSIAEFYDDEVTAGSTTEPVPLRGIVGG